MIRPAVISLLLIATPLIAAAQDSEIPSLKEALESERAKAETRKPEPVKKSKEERRKELKLPKAFIPSEKVSADSAVAFPVDI